MRLSSSAISALLASTACAVPSQIFKRDNDTGYELKQGPLDTNWTSQVGTNPWPQYPRPQLQRSDWKNLNGVWKYQNATSADALNNPPFGGNLSQSVLVPFCLESALSGVMTEYNIWSWYQTTFDVPTTWTKDNRVLLNFGAVDYEATIFVNGKNLYFHRGGYFTFTVDVTDALNAGGSNELLVFVYDPTDSSGTDIPLGKQTLDRTQHIFYTPCSGIWQTVWLESAPADYVTQLDVSAAMDGTVNVTVHNYKNGSTPVEITVYEPNSTDVKATASGTAGTAFQFQVDSPDLWSPDSPTLYNLTVKLGDDTIQSYTGFRTISSGVIDGIPRPLLNGEFVFLFGTLDQGFWPDGIYTAPTYDAMIYDITTLKSIGYNMLRKHIKVEPHLFYYAADSLGILLIQDMPSLQPSVLTGAPCDATTPINSTAAQDEFNRELGILIEQHKSYPSIITWIIYNEGWGQRNTPPYPEFGLTDMVRSLDPTRLIDSVTGWHDHGAGDYHDNHHYPTPQCGTPWYSIDNTPYDGKRIGFQGEFGGIGHNVSIEHLWNVQASIATINQTYEIMYDLDAWNYHAHVILTELLGQIENYACSGGIWTETTDVEGEVNGMMTYDRRIVRPNLDQWNKDLQALYDAAKARGSNTTSVMMARADGLGML